VLQLLSMLGRQGRKQVGGEDIPHVGCEWRELIPKHLMLQIPEVFMR
jgi:hypothetical protein